MSLHEDEEVVKLIFGDHPPEDWRENQEFLTYLAELGNLGADRLAIEPDRVTDELLSVQSNTQELAFSNYKTFIQTSECSKQIYNEFGNTENHLENLITKMPSFLEKCEDFKSKAAEISTHRRLTSLTLAKHTTLLEILELPQLMDTVVRNQHYDEALELHAYVTKLWKKQPEVKILEDISKNVTNSVKLMLQQLLAQLRAPIQLPQCLKVISYLRRMDIFKESELRLKFLQARETWLQSVTNAVPRDDPYIHITRTMEVMRVHLFDIVTQYRAIFSDDNIVVDTEENRCDNRLLFSSWLSRKVDEFLSTLERDLEHDIGSLESLIGQAMYFGLSFSRVGFDFRPQLVPIFERTILKQVNKLLSVDGNQKVLTDSFIGLNLVKVGGMSCAYQTKEDVSQPPLLLIEFPPLAHVCNIVLAALNSIRLCAPMSIVGEVTSSVQHFLENSANLLLNFQKTNHKSWKQTEVLGFQNLCLVYKTVLLPYLQSCLSAVFPPKSLSEICGFSVSDLKTRNVGFIDTEGLCRPLAEFMPPEPEITASAESSSGVETDFVSDRMAELAVAVDQGPEEIKENGGNVPDEYKEEAEQEDIQNNEPNEDQSNEVLVIEDDGESDNIPESSHEG